MKAKSNSRNYLKRNLKKKRSPDRLTKHRRSILMSKIRSRGSMFETRFSARLKEAINRKFQLNVSSLRGIPDIVFTNERVCVFLDSDFWHGWQFPRWKHKLKNEYWKAKILRNRERDSSVSRYLRRKGWVVLRFWEHEIKLREKEVINRILVVVNGEQLPNS